MKRTPWALGAALLLAAVLAVFATVPPHPRNAAATPAGAFSAERAMTDVRAIARAPHPTGSQEDARVRAYLAARLSGMGLAVRFAAHPISATGREVSANWSGGPASAQVINVIGVAPGRDRSAPAVLLMAHHDTVWASPGAPDDTAGVASALEIVRALRSGPPLARDLVVLFTDGEEVGLEGARGFFAADPERGRIGAVVNLEARGGGGRTAMFETGRDNGGMMRLFATAVHAPNATSLSSFIYEQLPNDTDFTLAKRAGLGGFNFAFIGRPELYHSPLATPARLDQGAMQDMGAQALDVVRALASAQRLPGAAPNLVYFDLFSLVLVHYPQAWGWGVLALAALLLGAAVARSREPARRIAEGAAATVALVVLVGAALWAFNLISGAGRGANYYDRLAAIPLLSLQAGLLCAAGALAIGAFLRRAGGDGARTAAGLAAPLLLLAAAAQLRAPTIAFLFAWPLVLAGIGALAVAGGRAWLGWLAIATAGLGTGWLAALSLFMFEGVGPNMPWVSALPLALAAPMLAPLLPPVRRRAVIGGVLALTALALATAVYVRLDPMAPTVPPYSLKR